MRRTLHLLPVDLAVVAHQATLAYRERDALRLAAKAGADPALLDRVGEHLTAVLAEGPLTPRQIEAALGRHGVDVPQARAGVKVAWERGRLTYLNLASGWNQERRDIARAAGHLTQVLRAGWAGIPRARGLPHPDQLALAI
jgi:hypothetical protein